MSHNYTDEEKSHLKAAQADAQKLLQDPASFNKRFEELFSKYDKNKDGLIGFEEYPAFISEMLISMGRTKVQSSLLLTYFQRADNDRANIGTVPSSRFAAILSFFKLDVNEKEMNVIIKRFFFFRFFFLSFCWFFFLFFFLRSFSFFSQ